MPENTITKKANAEPTKDFFISVLVRDIQLNRAILDLVDNCVDGAIRLKSNDFNGLSVRIELDKDHFKIADNCGGIPVDIAINYAFRFGRPAEAEATPHSIGQFGVGMKRALFKIGSVFKIESTTSNSKFIIEEDINEWKKTQEWQFNFKVLQEGLKGISPENQGTIITVTELYDANKQVFDLENFRTRLTSEIAAAHQESIQKGLKISVNGIPIQVKITDLLQSDQLKPAFKELTLCPDSTPVHVKLFTGISESSPQDAGWYIYCNGRLVLGPDRTATTVWGDSIPIYHNQFARFRGYAFFDCDDATNLPWNTTKTGVDTDSAIYKSVKLEMGILSRAVIDFLNWLDAEKDETVEEKPLEEAVKKATKTPLSNITVSEAFVIPPRVKLAKPKANTTTITFSKPTDEVQKVKKSLKAYSNREVGERVFEYYYEMECND